MLYSAKQYQKLAEKTRFSVQVKRDITANTLPTYSYLRQLAKQQRVVNKMAMLETAVIELSSRLRLINYRIYGFQKQG
jgi:hypothetical protein